MLSHYGTKETKTQTHTCNFRRGFGFSLGFRVQSLCAPLATPEGNAAIGRAADSPAGDVIASRGNLDLDVIP